MREMTPAALQIWLEVRAGVSVGRPLDEILTLLGNTGQVMELKVAICEQFPGYVLTYPVHGGVVSWHSEGPQ